jgi:ASCH domain
MPQFKTVVDRWIDDINIIGCVTPMLMKSQEPEIALSVRQPYAELILRGTKKIEYRSVPTSKRERVYIYASLQRGPADDFKGANLKAGDLPTGVIVGTVEIQECKGKPGDYHWHLARPQRLKTLIKPRKHPQPVWFRPF